MFVLNEVGRLFSGLSKGKCEDADNELQPNFVLAPWHENYHPAEVVSDGSSDNSSDGGDGDSSSTVRVCFLHSMETADIDAKSIIHYFGNMMNVCLSFCYDEDDVFVGKIYGNDSPKYEGSIIETFYIRVNEKDIYTVPVKDIFFTKSQIKKLLCDRKFRKSMFVYD